MHRLFLALATLCLLVVANTRAASACDPNESCNRCMASAFGHCITNANDLICEARKKACQISPALADAPGSPFGIAGPFRLGGPPNADPGIVRDCLQDLIGCPKQASNRVGYELVRPVVDAYMADMQRQAGNRLLQFPEAFIQQTQPFYTVNLRAIRYAEMIDTYHHRPMTIGNVIYLTERWDVNSPADRHLMYHELQHSQQYADRGGIEPFMAEYLVKSGNSLMHSSDTNTAHDNIDLEREAEQKAFKVDALLATNSIPGQNTQQISDAGRCRFSQIGWCPMPNLVPSGLDCHCTMPNGAVMGGVTTPN